MKKGLKKAVKKVKSVSKTVKSLLVGDSGNKRIKYQNKRASLEFQSFDKEKKKINQKMEEALRNPDKYKGRKLLKLKRRHLAANTNMTRGDERRFYRTRENKVSKNFVKGLAAFNVASYGALPVAAAVGGPAALAATQAASSVIYNGSIGAGLAIRNRKHILDKRYDYMKKHGYIK